jgi:hypothetical protein
VNKIQHLAWPTDKADIRQRIEGDCECRAGTGMNDEWGWWWNSDGIYRTWDTLDCLKAMKWDTEKTLKYYSDRPHCVAKAIDKSKPGSNWQVAPMNGG